MQKISIDLVRGILIKYFEESLGVREIVRQMPQLSASTVSRKINDFKESKLNWEEVSSLSNEEFELALYPSSVGYVPIPYDAVYEFLTGDEKRTIERAFEKIYQAQPAEEGQSFYKYSRFCELYAQWLKSNTGYGSVSVVPCEPGDYLEIDFSGDLLRWIDPKGNNHIAHVFVGSLRYSKLFYAEGFENEKAQSWLTGTVHALEYFDGSPRALVCDNAKALVRKSDIYVGEVTAALDDLCRHYQMQAHTCPIKRPSRKQSVEFSANLVEAGPQLDLQGLEGKTYAADLAELNAKLLTRVNERNLNKWTNGAAGSRRSCFETMEKPHLRALPALAYEPCRWTLVTANKRYLVTVEHQCYMVNWTEAGKKVAVAVSPTEVRFYRLEDHTLVGRYPRDYGEYRVHTDEGCMSPADLALRRGYQGAADSFTAKGYGLGHILRFIKALYDCQDIPAMTRYNILGAVRKLCERHGPELIDQACRWAAENGFLQEYSKIKNRVNSLVRDRKNREKASKAKGGVR